MSANDLIIYPSLDELARLRAEVERLTRERDEARFLEGVKHIALGKAGAIADRLAAALRGTVAFLESEDAEYRCTSKGWQATLDAARAALKGEE